MDRHYWPVRERIVFKTSLWERAHEFVSNAFADQDGKFLAVHWRRGDFVAARRPDVVKTAAEVAPRIKAMMAEYPFRQTSDQLLKSRAVLVLSTKSYAAWSRYGLEAIYLATGPDTMPSDIEDLHQLLGLPKTTIARYRKDSYTRYVKSSATTLALLDQIICALGTAFVGTKTSLFTATIMEERELLGQPFATTKNEFGNEKPG